MNPQNQPTEHSRQQPESLPSPSPDAATPSLPAPAPPQPAQNLYSPEDATPEPTPSQAPAAEHFAAPADLRMQSDGKEVLWTASEYVEHEKSQNWYFSLAGIALVVTILVYVITREILSTAVVVVAAVLFGVTSGRRARNMQYGVNNHGIGIGRRFYTYDNFRSFSFVDEGPVRSIVLMPLKRFMPPLTLYYDPADEERIGDVLADHLPFAEHQHELTDRLMRKIRF